MTEFREREYQEEQRARRDRRDRREREHRERRDRDEIDGYQHDDEASTTDRDEPLRIEAPVQPPAVDFRNLGAPQQQQNLAANISGGLVSSLAPGPEYSNGQPAIISARGKGEGAGPASAHMLQSQASHEQAVERREREQQDQIDRGGGQNMINSFDASRYSQEV